MAVTGCSATMIQAALTTTRTVPCRRRLNCAQNWTTTAAALRSRHCKAIHDTCCADTSKPTSRPSSQMQLLQLVLLSQHPTLRRHIPSGMT